MTWLIFELQNRTVMGTYEGSKNESALSSDLPLLHIELPPGVQARNCLLIGDEGSYEVIEGAPYEVPAAITPAEVLAATEDGRRRALSSARYCLVTKFNQGLSDKQWLGYDESLPGDKTPIVVPVNSKLREITFSWPGASVDGVFKIYKNGMAEAHIVFSHTFSNSGPTVVNNVSLQLNAGDVVRGMWTAAGDSPTDAVIVYVLEVTDNG